MAEPDSADSPLLARRNIGRKAIPVKAVTLDFYKTLAYHRAGIGRGRQYQHYLSAAGFTSDPWERRVLYEMFDYYAAAYSPTLTGDARLSFWTEFTRRLFERTNVRAPEAIDYAEHSQAIRDIMGPNCFALFDEALEVLRALKAAGLLVGVISDWQKGLKHFCDELGIGAYLDVVVASDEVGCSKPDPRLFETARERLKVDAREILHVGDRIADVQGAQAAGFAAALLIRGEEPALVEAPVIGDLRGLLALI